LFIGHRYNEFDGHRTLVNTATVSAVFDSGSSSIATDIDTFNSSAGRADLSVTKTDGQTTVVPGATVTYAIGVHNSGPSDVGGVKVFHTFSNRPGSITWTAFGTVGTVYLGGGSGKPQQIAGEWLCCKAKVPQSGQ
jgi:uncharacterized repeat protein (TIGR01451 family)